jgi:pyruvate kinase
MIVNDSGVSSQFNVADRSLTKIIATLGPATATDETITRLIECGVDIVRINFGHGSPEEHARLVRTVRAASKKLGFPVAVLGDLQGPKIRVGKVAGDGIDLAEGAEVVFQREAIEARPSADDERIRFSSTYERLVDDAEAGHRLLINDGAVRLLIVEKKCDDLVCRVTHGGRVTSGKGINLPETDLTVETLTERDWRDVRWSIEQGLDVVALSFVRTSRDVRELKKGIARIAAELGREGVTLPVVAKIETPRALEAVEGIVDVADGMMIARGDLGVEMDLAEVPIIQKRLIAVARRHGIPCIVATQMLQSMIVEPLPTRAEANDVAGAIFDEVDAVMLSGETSIGAHPVLAVEHMKRIAEAAERYVAHAHAGSAAPAKLVELRYHAAGLAHGVWTVANDIGARCIIVWSESGAGARYLSQNRFDIPILAATSDARSARQMQLLRGVVPVRVDPPEGIGAFISVMDAMVRDTGLARDGDACIVVAGEPLGSAGVTDTVRIHVVGEA